MRRIALAAALMAGLFALQGCNRNKDAAGEFNYTPPDFAELAKSQAAAKAWMEENAKKPGVMTLPSGVQYSVVKSGPAGGMSPSPEDEVKVNYEGALTDGTVFDSSYQSGQPQIFRLGGLIPAWVDALQMMKPGDEWMLYVPPDQGYGDRPAGPIPPNSVLVFKIELLGVLPAGSPEANG